MTAGLCSLELAVGREEDCPGHRCPFWDSSDGAGCVVDGVEERLLGAAALAEHLLELRTALLRARRANEEDAAQTALRRALETSP